MKTRLKIILSTLIMALSIEAQTTNNKTTFAIAEGDTFASGTTITFDDITLTFGEEGGPDFLPAMAERLNNDFSAYTPGNNVNGNKASGTFYVFKPLKDGEITIGVKQNRSKSLYIEEDGVVMTQFNGITLTEEQPDSYLFTVTVKAGSTYKLYCVGSKLGFYGFVFKTGENSQESESNTFETAAEAVKNMKMGINCLSFELDGYNYRYSNDRNWKSEWEWVGQNAAELPKMLRNAGYNTMRLMISWRRFMDSSGKIDTQWMAHVRECVDYVIDQGMYCTISNLFDTGEEGRLIYSEEENYKEYKELFEYFWVQVAEEFKDYDHHLIFEGWNEMLDSYGWEGNPIGYANPEQFEPLNEYAQSFVNAVRSTGGNNSFRNLLINTFGACGGMKGDWIPGIPSLSYFKVPQDKNIGHIFVGIHAYYDVTDMNALAEFDNCMTKWREWSESNAVPIILGEIGLGSMVKDYFEHPEETKNFWRHIVKSSRSNNIIPFVFLWSPLGTYRQMPAFDVPDLHKAILKGYYGEDYEPRMLTDDDYNVWISFKPENAICWMWTDPLETHIYKGFRFEIENYPGDGLLDMHIGDGENFVIKPVTSASTFFEFTPDEVGNDAGGIFIEYKGNEPYTMKVKRIVMQKRDGREFTFAAPIWIQRHDPNGWMGPNFESKRKQFVHTVGFDKIWAELNLFDDEIPLKLKNYKGIRVEFAEPINVDDFEIKVYADNGAVEDGQAPNSSTSATILFSDFNVNDVINRVTLQYCKENKGEAKVVSTWLIRQDGTEEYSDISPWWGCKITNAVEIGKSNGDVNGDGKLDVADIVAMENYINKKPTLKFNTDTADLNNDGKINQTDVNILVNIILSAQKQ